nr:protein DETOXIFICATION 16-like [Ipomoea batatas]
MEGEENDDELQSCLIISNEERVCLPAASSLSGAARGCGWQNLCAFINLGAYYVVGLPSSVLFAFVFHIGGMGLWMGIICALVVQNVALIAINLFTDWDKEARTAISRVNESRLVNGTAE